MAGTNEFRAFATAPGANVLSPATYAALPAVATGFVDGIAVTEQLNTVWRQSSFIAAVVAQIVVNGGLDALDNGDVVGFTSSLIAALETQLALASTAISYKPVGVGTVTRTAASKFADVRSVTDYGAKCDGITDDYAAFMAAYNDVPDGALLTIPAGTCILGTAPVFATKRVSWQGAGSRQTVLRYTGANTTNDVFTFGTAATELNGIRLEGIGFASSTVMTAGAGVHFYNLTRSSLYDLHFGHQDDANTFYYGVWFDGVDFVTLDTFQARAQQDAVRVNGNGPKADLFLANGKISSAMVGVHIGGNFGGFQAGALDIINNATNILIDQTIVASPNRETFFGPGTMIDTADTTRTATTYNGIGVDIQDTGGLIFFNSTWNATAGTLVRIGANFAGEVKFDGGILFNAFTQYGGNGRAIDNSSPFADVIINETRFLNVWGAGIYSSVATSNFTLNNPIFAPNVTAPVSSNITPTSNWTYQSANQAIMGKMAIGSRVQYPSAVSGVSDVTIAGSGSANFTAWNASHGGYWLSLGHSKNAVTGAQATVGSGDMLGGISFEGSDGTAFRSGAQIVAYAVGSPTNGQIPTVLYFVTSDGTSTNIQATLSSTGNLYIGRTGQVIDEKLSVNGKILGISPVAAFFAYNPTVQTSIMLDVGDAAANQHKVELISTTDGSFTIRSIDDAYSMSVPVFTAVRGTGINWTNVNLNNGKFSVDSSGNALVKAAGGLGYGTGAGGTVTQATSKTTGVTLNRPSGQITMNAAALAAAATVCFTLTNSLIAATDVVNVSIAGGATAGAYTLQVEAVANGSANICVTNRSSGSLSEAIVINFAVIKGSVS